MLNSRVLAGLATAAVLGLIGCTSPDSGPRPVSWTVSWDAVTEYEGGDSLDEKPTYEVHMASDGAEWQPVWSGAETTATIYALPGKRCFRAVAIAGGVKSSASEVVCTTKFSEKTQLLSAN
jgi:hypothetical protein